MKTEKLLIEIDDLVQKGYINEQVDGSLSLFDYSDQTTFERYWNNITKMCRGLIIDRETNTIVCNPVRKFFNYLENPEDVIPEDLPFEVQEKADGSCLFLWNYKNKWRCSTRGSFKSDQALWAQKFIDDRLQYLNLDTSITYMFEVVYPANKIVVNYKGFAGLYALTAIRPDGSEVSREYLEKVFGNVNQHIPDSIRFPKIYNYTDINSIVDICKSLPKDEEGFVCKWSNGLRLKFKGAEYIRIHKLISDVKPLPIWDMLRNGDDMELIKKQLPEEFWEEFDLILNNLQSKYEKIKNANIDWTSSMDMTTMTRKEFAIKAIQAEKQIPLINSAILFFLYDGKFDRMKKLIWEMVRPTGNQL